MKPQWKHLYPEVVVVPRTPGPQDAPQGVTPPTTITSTITISSITTTTIPLTTSIKLITTTIASIPPGLTPITSVSPPAAPSHAGEEAGIGIGCAVIGAIIGALIAFVVMQRKVKRLNRSRNDRNLQRGEASYNNGKGGEVVMMNEQFGNKSNVSSLDHLLPQPVDTRQLASDMSKLQSLMRNHVSNFYTTQPSSPQNLLSLVNSDALSEVAKESYFSHEEWGEILADTATRTNAIRYALSWTILRRLEPSCDVSRTLLPPGVARCLQGMGGTAGNQRESEYLKSKWRVITGVLQHDRYVRNSFKESDDRYENLENTILTLDDVLKPLATPGNDSARLNNLREILKRAALLGMTLVSQPSKSKFDWSLVEGGRPTKKLVIFPALVQYMDDTGTGSAAPLDIGEKEFAQKIFV